MNPLAGPTAAPLPPGVPDAPTEAFAVLRDVLTSAKFDERTVSARLGVPSLYDVKRLADGRTTLASTPEDANGVLVDGVMNADKLHPTLKGYQIWADALKPILRELLGPPAPTDLAPPPTGDPSKRGSGSG